MAQRELFNTKFNSKTAYPSLFITKMAIQFLLKVPNWKLIIKNYISFCWDIKHTIQTSRSSNSTFYTMFWFKDGQKDHRFFTSSEEIEKWHTAHFTIVMISQYKWLQNLDHRGLLSMVNVWHSTTFPVFVLLKALLPMAAQSLTSFVPADYGITLHQTKMLTSSMGD